MQTTLVAMSVYDTCGDFPRLGNLGDRAVIRQLLEQLRRHLFPVDSSVRLSWRRRDGILPLEFHGHGPLSIRRRILCRRRVLFELELAIPPLDHGRRIHSRPIQYRPEAPHPVAAFGRDALCQPHLQPLLQNFGGAERPVRAQYQHGHLLECKGTRGFLALRGIGFSIDRRRRGFGRLRLRLLLGPGRRFGPRGRAAFSGRAVRLSRRAILILRLGGRGRWHFDRRQTPQLLHHIRDDGLGRLVRRLQCHPDAFQAGAGGCPRAIFCARQVDRVGLPGALQRCNDFLSGVLDDLLLGSRRSLKPRVVEIAPTAVPVGLGADFVVDAAKWTEEWLDNLRDTLCIGAHRVAGWDCSARA